MNLADKSRNIYKTYTKFWVISPNKAWNLDKKKSNYNSLQRHVAAQFITYLFIKDVKLRAMTQQYLYYYLKKERL